MSVDINCSGSVHTMAVVTAYKNRSKINTSLFACRSSVMSSLDLCASDQSPMTDCVDQLDGKAEEVVRVCVLHISIVSIIAIIMINIKCT